MDATKILINESEKMKIEYEITACFTNNQCQASMDRENWDSGEDDSNSNEGDTPITSAEKVHKNQTLQCIEGVFPKFFDDVASCVLKATGLTIPTGLFGGHFGFYGPASAAAAFDDKGPNGKRDKSKPTDPEKMKAKMEAILKKACEKSSVTDAATKLHNCLNATKSSAMQKYNEYCAARNSCVQGMASSSCNIKDQQNNNDIILNATHKCMMPMIADATLQKLASGVTKCNGFNLTEIVHKYYMKSDKEDTNEPWGQEGPDPRYKTIINKLGGTNVGPLGGLDLEDFLCASFHGVDVPEEIHAEINYLWSMTDD